MFLYVHFFYIFYIFWTIRRLFDKTKGMWKYILFPVFFWRWKKITKNLHLLFSIFHILDTLHTNLVPHLLQIPNRYPPGWEEEYPIPYTFCGLHPTPRPKASANRWAVVVGTVPQPCPIHQPPLPQTFKVDSGPVRAKGMGQKAKHGPPTIADKISTCRFTAGGCKLAPCQTIFCVFDNFFSEQEAIGRQIFAILSVFKFMVSNCTIALPVLPFLPLSQMPVHQRQMGTHFFFGTHKEPYSSWKTQVCGSRTSARSRSWTSANKNFSSGLQPFADPCEVCVTSCEGRVLKVPAAPPPSMWSQLCTG